VETRARRAAARQALTALEASLGASTAALWYAALGDKDRALAALELAYERRADPTFPYKLVHPLLRGLHGEAAFRSIAADVGVVVPGGAQVSSGST
jgi:hypothetical protein